MQDMLKSTFGTAKPVVGMIHFPPLPGTPLFDERSRLKQDRRERASRSRCLCSQQRRRYGHLRRRERQTVPNASRSRNGPRRWRS